MEGIVYVLVATGWILKVFWYIAWYTFPFVLPPLLALMLWESFLIFKRSEFLSKQEKVLLEIRMPRQIEKSPLAMELFMNALYQTGSETNWWKRYVRGSVRAVFSLEMVSLGGEVKFFIWTWKQWKDYVESQLYGQYPELEIYEVEDYSLDMPWDFRGYQALGAHYKLAKADHFPLQTYVDFKMDRETETEARVRTDPLSATVELLGSNCGPHEMLWVQLVIRAHKTRREWGDVMEKWFGQKEVAAPQGGSRKVAKPQNIVDEGKYEIVALSNLTKKLNITLPTGDKAETDVSMQPNEQQRQQIDAINRKISKNAFDVGLRTLYIAEEGYFVGPKVPQMLGVFRQFGSKIMNEFRPLATTDYDFPWEDDKVLKTKEMTNIRSILEAYKRRSFFYQPFKYPHVVLNSEELASLFHPPAGMISGPVFGGTVSKKSEPPANLPTG